MNLSAPPGISAILLFGSRARRDIRRGSDTDLLLIGPPGLPRHKSIGHLSMFFYSWDTLADNARTGDLFVCHIVREARAVFDPGLQLAHLRSLFRLRDSYAPEIAQACDLGVFLDRYAPALDGRIVARRMIWCIRTVLIARLAEQGRPAFAPTALAEIASPPAVALLDSRHQRKPDAVMRQRFRQFLAEEGATSPLSPDASLDDWLSYFDASDNRIAQQTIAAGAAAPEREDETLYS